MSAQGRPDAILSPSTDRIVSLNKERGELLLKLREIDKQAVELAQTRERFDLRLRMVEAALEGVDIATAALKEQVGAASTEKST